MPAIPQEEDDKDSDHPDLVADDSEHEDVGSKEKEADKDDEEEESDAEIRTETDGNCSDYLQFA